MAITSHTNHSHYLHTLPMHTHTHSPPFSPCAAPAPTPTDLYPSTLCGPYCAPPRDDTCGKDRDIKNGCAKLGIRLMWGRRQGRIWVEHTPMHTQIPIFSPTLTPPGLHVHKSQLNTGIDSPHRPSTASNNTLLQASHPAPSPSHPSSLQVSLGSVDIAPHLALPYPTPTVPHTPLPNIPLQTM